MAANRRALTLEEVKRRAADLDGMFEDYQEQQALESRFRDVTSGRLVEMWESGKNEDGKRLTQFELRALAECWTKRFGCVPPADKVQPTPAQPKEQQLADDTIIHMPEILRRTGVSESEIKRMRKDGRFPAAIKLGK